MIRIRPFIVGVLQVLLPGQTMEDTWLGADGPTFSRDWLIKLRTSFGSAMAKAIYLRALSQTISFSMTCRVEVTTSEWQCSRMLQRHQTAARILAMSLRVSPQEAMTT